MKKKMTTVMIVHLILMGILAVMNVYAIIRSLAMSADENSVFRQQYGSTGVLYVAIWFFNIAALVFGIVYLLRGYEKNAAGFYKAYLLIVTAVFVLRAVAVLYIFQSFTINLLLSIINIVLFLVLAFWPNLGKRATWILFIVLVILNLVGGFLWTNSGSDVAVFRVISVLSRLLFLGTVGLNIRGKYEDKDARGTV